MKRIIVLCSILLLLVPLTALGQDFCEGDFNCDGDQDGADAAAFKTDFGRSSILNPCTNESPCNGDFSCNGGVDGTDAALFKSDFGRSQFHNPCPAGVSEKWCTYTTTSSTTTTCAIAIVYGRPGRRGLPLTCNDVVGFTLCSDCSAFDPSCLLWTISPAVSWLSIDQIDDCSWRLIIGDYCCQEPDPSGEYEITVTDTCNNVSDSVIIVIL